MKRCRRTGGRHRRGCFRGTATRLEQFGKRFRGFPRAVAAFADQSVGRDPPALDETCQPGSGHWPDFIPVDFCIPSVRHDTGPPAKNGPGSASIRSSPMPCNKNLIGVRQVLVCRWIKF